MASATQSLDVRGEICPYPLFETKKKMEALPSGAQLEVFIDYPLALDNITRWVKNNGHKVVSVEELGASEWRLLLEHA